MSRRELVVVRHAHALARHDWQANDSARPLSPTGRAQAEALAREVGTAGDRPLALSSPALRCIDTLAPFARDRGVALEHLGLLGEGNSGRAALAALVERGASATGKEDGVASDAAVTEAPMLVVLACTHGDVIDALVAHLARAGVPLSGPPGHPVLETPKAGRWHLELDGDEVRSARLVGPPSSFALDDD